MDKSARFHMRLRPEQHARLEHLAAAMDLPASELVRALLDGCARVDDVDLVATLLRLRLAEPHYDQVEIEPRHLASLTSATSDADAA